MNDDEKVARERLLSCGVTFGTTKRPAPPAALTVLLQWFLQPRFMVSPPDTAYLGNQLLQAVDANIGYVLFAAKEQAKYGNEDQPLPVTKAFTALSDIARLFRSYGSELVVLIQCDNAIHKLRLL